MQDFEELCVVSSPSPTPYPVTLFFLLRSTTRSKFFIRRNGRERWRYFILQSLVHSKKIHFLNWIVSIPLCMRKHVLIKPSLHNTNNNSCNYYNYSTKLHVSALSGHHQAYKTVVLVKVHSVYLCTDFKPVKHAPSTNVTSGQSR